MHITIITTLIITTTNAERLHTGALHAETLAEMTAARKKCDRDRRWRAPTAADDRPGIKYMYHSSTARRRESQRGLPRRASSGANHL